MSGYDESKGVAGFLVTIRGSFETVSESCLSSLFTVFGSALPETPFSLGEIASRLSCLLNKVVSGIQRSKVGGCTFKIVSTG